MSEPHPTDLSRCAVHTRTNKPWSLGQCVEHYQQAGIAGISVWRNVVAPDEGGVGLAESVRILSDSDLEVPAYVRGGFFPSANASDRQQAIDLNRRCVDEAAALGAKMVVLVVGAEPGMPLAEARKQVADGIGAVLGHVEAMQGASGDGPRLAIEPLHPMYAADKSCINRLAEARQVCDELAHPLLGIAVDVYHVWWDPDLEREIQLAANPATPSSPPPGGVGQLFGFHVCDWRANTRHLLTDRGLMGEGVIDIPHIRRTMLGAGYHGFNEVEVFSQDHWAKDQPTYLHQITAAYLNHT